jgi:hypothetical protein
LHVLAWAPVLPFTRVSVRSGEMHDACCWVIEQRRGLFTADEALRSVNKLGVAARRTTTLCRSASATATMTTTRTTRRRRSSAATGSKAGEATQHVHVEPLCIWLAFLDERHTVWFQSSATHVATLRRMANRAFADPALLTTSPSSLAAPACCCACADARASSTRARLR